jgi:hypothetical protein
MHLWFLVGEPPTDAPEHRVFECDTCGDRIPSTCEVGRSDPYPLDPFREAVGRVIQDYYGLEVFLGLVATRVLELSGHDWASAEARVAKLQSGGHVDVIRKAAPSALPSGDAGTLLAVLDEVEAVLSARHHLVHGYWMPNSGRTEMWAQKSGRSGKPWTEQRFDRRSLLELRRTVLTLSGDLQSWRPAQRSGG